MRKEIGRKQFLIYLGLFIYVALLLFVCSSTSPLYKSHDWVDSNIFYTIGNGWLNGYIPYKDLTDQKGPLLYFIYMIGAFITHNSFAGIYLLLVISMFLTALCIYKLSLLFSPSKKRAIFVVGITIFFILSSNIYFRKDNGDFGGGSAEEFCLPIFTLSLFIFAKNEKENKWDYKSFVIMGLLAGIIFQIKFTLCLFWLGLLLPVFISILKNKEFKRALLVMVSFLVPFITIQLPYIIYALCTDSFTEYINMYFLVNIIYKINNESLLGKLIGLFRDEIFILMNNPTVVVSIIGSIIGLLLNKDMTLRCKISLFFSMICLLFVIMLNQTAFYAHLPLQIYSFFFILLIIDNLNIPFTFKSKKILPSILGVFIFVITILENGLLLAKIQLREYPTVQQQVEDIVKNGPFEDPQIFEAGMLSRGFYNKLNQQPPIKYFLKYNIKYDNFPDPMDMQLEHIISEESEYIILLNTQYLLTPENYKDYIVYEEPIIQKMFNEAFSRYNLVDVILDRRVLNNRVYYYVFEKKI